MTCVMLILVFLVAIDGYIISQIYKHEIAIIELLKRHPDMLIDWKEGNEK